MLDGEHLAGPTEPCLDLVRDHEDAVLIAYFANRTQEGGRARHVPAGRDEPNSCNGKGKRTRRPRRNWSERGAKDKSVSRPFYSKPIRCSPFPNNGFNKDRRGVLRRGLLGQHLLELMDCLIDQDLLRSIDRKTHGVPVRVGSSVHARL